MDSQELYDLLKTLDVKLRARGAGHLSIVLECAIGQAGTSPSEFFGESRIALSRVAAESEGLLAAEDHKKVSDALGQLESWFRDDFEH
jgi:hypothetical protein